MHDTGPDHAADVRVLPGRTSSTETVAPETPVAQTHPAAALQPPAAPSTIHDPSPMHIQALQRTLGNQAINQILALRAKRAQRSVEPMPGHIRRPGRPGAYSLVAQEQDPLRQRSDARKPAPSGVAFPVQRSIGCHMVAGGGEQFQIDPFRPPWSGGALAIPVGPGQHLAHIIAFEHIQNDLANALNAMLLARGTMAYPAASAQLTALCNALYAVPSPDQALMNVRRLAIDGLIAGIPPGVIGAANRALLTFAAQNLLDSLNSCPDNLRPGNAATNIAIGHSVDAEFLPGSFWYWGPIAPPAPAAAMAAPPAGAGPLIGPGAVPAPAGAVVVAFECVRLTAAHNQKVYRYGQNGGVPLTFVISGVGVGAAALHPGFPAGRHLSSSQAPTVQNVPPFPVLVHDPAGVGLPFVFS